MEAVNHIVVVHVVALYYVFCLRPATACSLEDRPGYDVLQAWFIHGSLLLGFLDWGIANMVEYSSTNSLWHTD